MQHYCTIFDSNYVPRFLTMLSSMHVHCGEFRIYTFCMDDASYSMMLELKDSSVIPVHYTDLEKHDPELKAAKSTRSLIEYYFTCTPAIANYVFSVTAEIDLLTYLDADLYFYSSPEVIFREIGDGSVAIVEHRFSRFGKKFIKNGRFNVAWITYKRDENGMACLKDYRKQCIAWCYDYLDGDRFADQKYLDRWPDHYTGVRIIVNKGVNLAPWNIGNYTLSKKGTQIFVDNDELVFYHYAGLKQLKTGLYTTTISAYLVFITALIREDLYGAYIRKLLYFTKTSDTTAKTVNPKYQKFSIQRTMKEKIRQIRRFIFRDYVSLKTLK